jgi:hypothetical protein
MRIVFNKVVAPSPEAYVRAKLTRGFRVSADSPLPDGSAIDTQVASVLAEQLGARVPIVPPDAVGSAAPGQEADVEARKRCALMMAMRQWPLLDGEAVEEDVFTCLQEPFGGLPARTAAMRRTTNMAELYFLFDDVQVNDGSVVFTAPIAPPQAAHRLGDVKESIAAAMGKSLATGLASAIGGRIGALIFDTVFQQQGVPSYFDEVYAEIRNIVKEELSAQLVEQVGGRVNGTAAWLRNMYKPRKEAGASRKELFDMVSKYVDSMYWDAVYTLMEKNHAKPGFEVFLLAAGLHMGLMQEQALVDPKEPDPHKSSFAKSVSLSAQEYHDHAIRTFAEILRLRGEAVVVRDVSTKTCVSHSCTTTYKYRWHDNVTGAEGPTYQTYTNLKKETHDGNKECEADRQRYNADVARQLTAKLCSPNDIAATWLKLKDRPIPI